MHAAMVALLMAPGDIPDADLFQRPAWQRRGACRGNGTDVFFPVRGESTDRAKALCTACVVRSECLAYAMADPELVGVWGGTSQRERRRKRQELSVVRAVS